MCGCAVVQPEVQPAHGVWSHGHVFDFPSKGQHKEPVLVDVRCPRHLPAWYNDCGCGR